MCREKDFNSTKKSLDLKGLRTTFQRVIKERKRKKGAVKLPPKPLRRLSQGKSSKWFLIQTTFIIFPVMRFVKTHTHTHRPFPDTCTYMHIFKSAIDVRKEVNEYELLSN